MVLLRRVIGDALRARRQGQHRTLREVSTAANVSLGYLSEIERGQKEASSELLAAICAALGAQLSELLRDVSETLANVEGTRGVVVPPRMPLGNGPTKVTGPARADEERDEPARDLVPVPDRDDTLVGAGVAESASQEGERVDNGRVPEPAHARLRPHPLRMPGLAKASTATATRSIVSDGDVSVMIRHEAPLRTTLRATTTRALHSAERQRSREVVCVG